MSLSDILKTKEYKQKIADLEHDNYILWQEYNKIESLNQKIADLEHDNYILLQEYNKIEPLNQKIADLEHDNQLIRQEYHRLGLYDYNQIKQLITQANTQYDSKINELNTLKLKIENQKQAFDNLCKKTTTQQNKLNKTAELVRAVNYALKNPSEITPLLVADLDMYAPTITLNLQCMNIKDLRKKYKANDAQINSLLESYSTRYTTKSNQMIYKLIVIGMRAELQNILVALKYERLEQAKDNVVIMTDKYRQLASNGNQTIYSTLSSFITEIEYLFLNAVEIEYNYYVKKEQAKQEQAAIREKMRQEAAERRALMAEKQKLEQEEQKYNTEIDKLRKQLTAASNEEIEALNKRILELQVQLSDMNVKKDEISRLANGKAGYVYIISNLGSFGDNIFKIGMTRRLTPQERIDELGSASVPFRFDVHSFIFSNDAVSLESKLHTILNDKRVNKVNLRKEFFYSTIDELEGLVNQIDPTAEFNKTMLAEEFYQSQSTDTVYITDEMTNDDDYDEEYVY